MVPGSAGAEPPPGRYLRDEGSGTLYRRGRLLGEGAFGRCYQVTEVTSGRLYAAKVIPRARLAVPGVADRVERERELQCHLRHPHIVRLHGHFAERGHLCLLLELCSRGSLADILRARGRLTEPELRYYLRQLLSGLRYLHGHGLVHRDLKLSNFLVTERMRVKIGDLGLARPAAPPGRRWGALCGTPAYLAPEVLERRGHAEPADIWALGCAVYTALSGHAPFEARRRSELYRRIRSARYPPPPGLSPPARALIARMLHPEPAARPGPARLLRHPFLTQVRGCVRGHAGTPGTRGGHRLSLPRASHPARCHPAPATPRPSSWDPRGCAGSCGGVAVSLSLSPLRVAVPLPRGAEAEDPRRKTFISAGNRLKSSHGNKRGGT
ncbi:inactive serine/threonine-protein kinase PLK5-like isoform X2 [Passer montanus]|uniref:inactive serine/threonine-protein kinase PLK5-like isoform X2 n=1 Tax=Passer montanus TaxID=9160 RepID=UPI00196032A6|nr:inactive serine/threonine-protein kinase PLK5-like isoform X2 [Passer montanus]